MRIVQATPRLGYYPRSAVASVTLQKCFLNHLDNNRLCGNAYSSVLHLTQAETPWELLLFFLLQISQSTPTEEFFLMNIL